MSTALQMPNPVATCLSYVGQPCRRRMYTTVVMKTGVFPQGQGEVRAADEGEGVAGDGAEGDQGRLRPRHRRHAKWIGGGVRGTEGAARREDGGEKQDKETLEISGMCSTYLSKK